MFEDHFMDMNDLSEGLWVSTSRCMNCGHAVDPVMAVNRQRRALLQVRQQEVVHHTLDDAVMPQVA